MTDIQEPGAFEPMPEVVGTVEQTYTGEREFWMQAYVAAVQAGRDQLMAMVIADRGLEAVRERWPEDDQDDHDEER